MGRKRQWPSPSVPERNRQFARHLNRLLSNASLSRSQLATLLGRTEVLIYKYLQGVVGIGQRGHHFFGPVGTTSAVAA